MKNYIIKIPVDNIILSDNKFETFEAAITAATNVLKDIKAIKFVSIFHEYKHLTNIIQTGYTASTFDNYRKLCNANRIKEVFILDKIYYIKFK
jgi:hypothetical protein